MERVKLKREMEQRRLEEETEKKREEEAEIGQKKMVAEEVGR